MFFYYQAGHGYLCNVPFLLDSKDAVWFFIRIGSLYFDGCHYFEEKRIEFLVNTLMGAFVECLSIFFLIWNDETKPNKNEVSLKFKIADWHVFRIYCIQKVSESRLAL